MISEDKEIEKSRGEYVQRNGYVPPKRMGFEPQKSLNMGLKIIIIITINYLFKVG